MAKELLNLVPAIHALEVEISEIDAEYRKKVDPYKRSLAELRKLNQACERCNGTGKILRSRACAEDDAPDPDDPTDYITCPECWGSGKSKKTN